MNKREWLKFIRHSTEAHHIREIFHGTYALIGEPLVQKTYFDRIDFLLQTSSCKHTRKSLEDLREDIEDEIDTFKMRRGILIIPKKEKSKAPTQASYNRIEIWETRISAMLGEVERLKLKIEKEKAKYVEA